MITDTAHSFTHSQRVTVNMHCFFCFWVTIVMILSFFLERFWSEFERGALLAFIGNDIKII